MIASAKTPPKEKPRFLCLEPQSEQVRINSLIDKCFQLSVADKNCLKKRFDGGDTGLLRIFQKHGKAACSLKLQIQLRKYLSTNNSQNHVLREKLTSRQKSIRFKIPANMQRSCSIKNQILADNIKLKGHRQRKQSISPKKPLQIERINSPVKPPSILFGSTKNRLKFKNEIKQMKQPVQTQLMNAHRISYSPIDKMKTCPSSDLNTKQVSQKCNVQSPPSSAATGITLMSPRLVKILTESYEQSIEASSIHMKQPTIDNSFRIFEMNNDQIEICSSENSPRYEQYNSFINKLKEKYAEDILNIFFKPYGRHILKDQFISILPQGIDVSLTSQSTIQKFADNLFKNSITLSPSMLGKFLQLFCLQKQTKTRKIFNVVSGGQKQSVNIADLYNFFSEFPQLTERRLKQLFQEDLSMLVLGQDSSQNLTYWDLYLMQESRCWRELWQKLNHGSASI